MSFFEIILISLFGWFFLLGVPIIIALLILRKLRCREIKRQAKFEIEVEKEKERIMKQEK